ncbi:MAG: hypothetical protein GOVbin2729_66 [Prokaryotic dsDNA virus sp.]|nr:MAG: hypothetical protein GOVbin2729_66 [Prokaryotic dsDNA virus sp.]|tara:strand:- start:7883 stop:8254 length:372 start_codon:yes stop_codon:yes gene_type:complete
MADGFKILAQATLTNTEATIYTVPTPSGERFLTRGNSQAVISSIILCCTNDAGGAGPNYSIRVKKSGEDADADKQIIFKEQAIALNETDVLSLGIGLVSGDSIEAACSSGDAVQMNIFGTEVL